MTHRIVICAALLLAATGAPAASFDCVKASTAVERLICATPELSRLDERLDAAYGEARKSTASPKALKAEQLAWLSERNRCADAECLKRHYAQRLSQLRAYANPGAAKPRYRLEAGMGYSICETFLKHLNALPPDAPPMVCDIHPNPAYNAVTRDDWDITQPEWEELDVQENLNLNLIYAAELELPPYYKYQYKYRSPPEPFPTFAEWKADFDARIEAGKIHPKLYRTRLALNEKGGVETLIGYEPSPEDCTHNLLKYDSARSRGKHLFVLNDAPEQPLKTIHGLAGSNVLHTALLYRGEAYLAWGGTDGPTRGYIELSIPSLSPLLGQREYVTQFRCGYNFER